MFVHFDKLGQAELGAIVKDGVGVNLDGDFCNDENGDEQDGNGNDNLPNAGEAHYHTDWHTER